MTVTLERLESPHQGETETVKARYVVGCDGARSIVRTAIGRELRLAGKRRVAKILGAAARAVAETKCVRIVPPAAGIVGCAEEDLAADIGMLEADADELRQIVRLDPDRQPPQAREDPSHIMLTCRFLEILAQPGRGCLVMIRLCQLPGCEPRLQ